MCNYHSFLFDANTGECLESVGIKHHTEIASDCGVGITRYLKPEFNIVTRSLEFPSGTLAQTIASMCSADSVAFAETRCLGDNRDAWNQDSLRRLSSFVYKRFGTIDGFLSHAEKNWNIVKEVAHLCINRSSKMAVPRMAVITEGSKRHEKTRQYPGPDINGVLFSIEVELRTNEPVAACGKTLLPGDLFVLKAQSIVPYIADNRDFDSFLRIARSELNAKLDREIEKVRNEAMTISAFGFMESFDEFASVFVDKANRIASWNAPLSMVIAPGVDILAKT